VIQIVRFTRSEARRHHGRANQAARRQISNVTRCPTRSIPSARCKSSCWRWGHGQNQKKIAALESPRRQGPGLVLIIRTAVLS